jgi:hypothetical protein
VAILRARAGSSGNRRRRRSGRNRQPSAPVALPAPDAVAPVDLRLGDLDVAALGVLRDGRIRFRVTTSGPDPRFTIVDVPDCMENPDSVAELFVATHEKVVEWATPDVDADHRDDSVHSPPASGGAGRLGSIDQTTEGK